MKGEGRREASAAEMAIAREELAAARTLASSGFHRIAVTRAYFAVFHGVRALLYSEGFEPRTHKGTMHVFHLHFVKDGPFDARTSRVLARLQKYREEADYGVLVTADAAAADEDIEAASDLVARVEKILAARSDGEDAAVDDDGGAGR